MIGKEKLVGVKFDLQYAQIAHPANLTGKITIAQFGEQIACQIGRNSRLSQHARAPSLDMLQRHA